MVGASVNAQVGIGTTTPGAQLEVVGSVRFSGDLQPAGDSGLDGEVLLSNGPGVAPEWGVRFLNPGAILGVAKAVTTTMTIDPSDITTYTIADPDIQTYAVASWNWDDIVVLSGSIDDFNHVTANFINDGTEWSFRINNPTTSEFSTRLVLLIFY